MAFSVTSTAARTLGKRKKSVNGAEVFFYRLKNIRTAAVKIAAKIIIPKIPVAGL
jgi:hypothetical protein